MLDKTHRFTDHRDVRDYNMLRSGDEGLTRRAIENMEMRGRVHVSYDRSDRMLKVFEDHKYFRDRDETLTADDLRIIGEGTNKEVDTAGAFIQADRKARGELRGDGFKVNEDATGRSWRLYENDSVIFLRPHFVSRKEKPVKNGTTGRITEINEAERVATVELEDGRQVKVPIPENAKRQIINQAYAQHANKIQGHETRIVQIIPGTDRTSNANSAYSQLTRAKDQAHTYLDYETHGEEPQKAVAKSWARRANKRMAITLMRERGLDPMQYVEEKTGAQRAREAREAREAAQAERHKAQRTEARQGAHDRQQQPHGRTRDGSLRGRVDDARDLQDSPHFGRALTEERIERDRGGGRSR